MNQFDPRELLSHTTWLRQLARSLVNEGAEDLVQDAWVAALRRPPHGDRGLRPWLRAVVTNAARLRWRSDAHREAREQVAASLDERVVPSSEELLERHELQQLLARLVSELDEPFRSTILLRFAEELSPTEIARRLAIPAGTVRWRLKEGLERLRARLDGLHKGDRRAWMLAFAPLAMPRTSPAASIIPVILALAAACAVGIGVLVLLIPGADRDQQTTTPRPAAASNRPAHIEMRSEGARRSALAWLAQEGVPPRHLTGRVLMKGAPAGSATVRLVGDPLPPHEFKTDASGRFDFGEQMPREYVVGAYLPGTLAAIRRIDLRDPSASHDIELILEDCSATLYGQVVDAAGTPIVGAHVMREGVVGTETDRAGKYELCVLPTAALVAELRIEVQADGFGTLTRAIAPPGRMRHDFILAPEATVSGRVVGPEGTAIASALVAIDLTGPDASRPPERGLSLTSVTDEDGRFRIVGLAAGEYTISATSADAVTPPMHVKVDAAENRGIELRAISTGIVRGRVVSKGLPVPGVAVAAGKEVAISQRDGSFVLSRVPVGGVALDTTPFKRTSGPIHVVEGDRNTVELVVEPMGILRGIVRRHGVPVPFARVDIAGPSRAGVTADASGRYEARGLEPGKYGFYCDDRKRGAMFAEERVVELGPGETRDHDIELAWGATIAGRVVNGHGDPVAGVMVSFRGGTTSDCLTDETGAYACGGLAGGMYTAFVRPASTAAHPFRFVETPPKLELRDGDARIADARLVVESTLAGITGTVTDRSGAPVADVTVRAFAVDLVQRASFRRDLATVTDEQGGFQLTELSAGDYYVEVERGGLATRQAVAAGAENVSLVLDRAPCDGAHAHDAPASLTRPLAPVVWNQQIELIGWSVPSTASASRPIELTLVYRMVKPVDRDWRIFVHFDSSTTRVNADHEPAIGWCPTSQWRAGETIVDRLPVQFEKTARYSLTIGFFSGSAPNWENLPVSAAPTAMANASQTGVHLADVVVR